MPRRLLVLLAVLLGIGIGGAAPAGAHPHVWIDARLAVAVDAEARVTALTVTWRLDALYSQTTVAGLDADGDGAYSPSELRPLIDESMRNLEEWFFFTDARKAEDRLPTSPVQDYEAFMDGDRLVYEFTLPLAEPEQPGQEGLRVRLFDPSLYIGIELEKKGPVTLQQPADACAYHITPAPGFEEALLISEDTFATDVEPGSDGVGSRFAETVVITCD